MNRDINKDWLRKQHVVKARNNNDIACSFCNPSFLFDNVLKYFVGEPFLVMRNWLKLQPLGRTLTACSVADPDLQIRGGPVSSLV